MSQLGLQTCEAKLAGSWHLIGVDAAFGVHLSAPKRCPVCHGSVSIDVYGKPARRRFVHRTVHTGCLRAPRVCSGTPSQHPDAVT